MFLLAIGLISIYLMRNFWINYTKSKTEQNIQQKQTLDKLNDSHNEISKDEVQNESNIWHERIERNFFFESEDELSETEDNPNNTELFRDIECLVELYNTENGVNELTDVEVMCLVKRGIMSAHRLEYILGDSERAVRIRRQLIADLSQNGQTFDDIPHTQYDYSLVMGACRENVVGYTPVPLGIAGPLILNNKQYFVPMATTQKGLVASTSRGCRAIQMSGGVKSAVYSDCRTRESVVVFKSAIKAAEAIEWLQIEANFSKIKTAFESTSHSTRLLRIESRIVGKYLYLRFFGQTRDAKAINVMSNGTESALKVLTRLFIDIESSYLSGNVCIDKKFSSVNWIEHKEVSVVCEAIIPAIVVKNILKTSVDSLIACNVNKNLIQSTSADANNAHSANIMAAIYIACGQNPAQIVDSFQCTTVMENYGPDLLVCTTMPTIVVGTSGGVTLLPAQIACLKILGINESSGAIADSNAFELATIVCGTVLAAKLSAKPSDIVEHC